MHNPARDKKEPYDLIIGKKTFTLYVVPNIARRLYDELIFDVGRILRIQAEAENKVKDLAEKQSLMECLEKDSAEYLEYIESINEEKNKIKEHDIFIENFASSKESRINKIIDKIMIANDYEYDPKYWDDYIDTESKTNFIVDFIVGNDKKKVQKEEQ